MKFLLKISDDTMKNISILLYVEYSYNKQSVLILSNHSNLYLHFH